MTVGSNTYINRNETDQSKINFALQQVLARTSGQQVNSSTSVSASYSLTVSDYLVNVTADNVALQLPAANAAPGQVYCIKLTSTGSTVSINPTTGNTIDGTTKQTINIQNQSIEFQSDGVSAWNIIKNKTGTSASLNSSSVLQSTNALSELASSLTTARSNLGLGNLAVMNSSSVLQTTNSLSELTPATARTNIGAAGTAQSIPSFFTWQAASPSANIWPLIPVAPFGMTLTSFSAQMLGGSVNTQLFIGGVAVSGGSISATTAPQSSTPNSANVVSLGANVTLGTSTPSAATGLVITVGYTKSVTLS